MAESKTLEVKIYLLTRINTPGPDEYTAGVVAAVSEKQARELANQESKAEGYIWTDGGLTEAKELGVANDGVSGVLLWSRE
jgi:hypothetical protein